MSWNGTRDSLVKPLWQELVSTCLERKLKLGLSTQSAESLVGLTFSGLWDRLRVEGSFLE